MAIPSMFEQYQLERLKVPCDFKLKGLRIYVDYASDFIYRAGHSEELQGAVVIRVKTFSNERVCQYILPLKLYPRRVYTDGEDCCKCKIECRKCQCVLCKDETESHVWDAHDIHSDVYADCKLRVLLLDILTKLTAASEREDTEILKQFFSVIASICKEIESEDEPKDKPEPVKAFRLEKVEAFKFRLFYLKDGKEHYRTVKSSRKEAEETLKALEVLESGGETDNVVARRIWGIKKDKAPVVTEESVYKELFELSQEDVRALKTELDDVKTENALLRRKLESLGSVDVKVCDFPKVADELYPNETMFQVRKVLEDFISQPTNNRSYQVIAEILNKLPVTEICEKYKDLFTNCIAGVSAQRRGELLSQIGYTQVQCNNCHYKIYPNGHPELSVVMAATPSDYRSNQNAVVELMHRLFD